MSSGRLKLALWLIAGLGLSLLALYFWRLPPAPSPIATPAKAIKVALVLPGPIDDRSWSQSGYEGLMLIKDKLGAHVAYSANVAPADAAGIFRRFAQEGFDFIILHGAQYLPAAEVVAEEFPRTKFAVVTAYPGNNKNFGALAFRAGEVGYLTGVVAALKTRTKKIAYLGGERYPITLEDTILFRRGVKAIDPNIRVSVEWVDSWKDSAKARRIAQEQVAKGADVLVVNADMAGTAALQVAEKVGIYAIGWNLDRYAVAPRAIITSALQRVPILLLEGATLVEQGLWEGKQYKFGLREGAQDLAPFRGKLSPEQEKIVQSVRDDLMLGRIDLTP